MTDIRLESCETELHGRAADNAAKTHCLRGHELIGDNVRESINAATGRVHRVCRACKRLSDSARRHSSSRRDQLLKECDDQQRAAEAKTAGRVQQHRSGKLPEPKGPFGL